jgi:hypothetical protein
VAGVLQQLTTNGSQPLAFFSAKLAPTEQKYSTFNRELLAAYLAVRHFPFLLEAREFHILTDHKTLTNALHRVSEHCSAWQQQHLSYMAEFTADLLRVAGKNNVVADTLSRPPPVPLASLPFLSKRWQAYHRRKCATVNSTLPDQDLFTFRGLDFLRWHKHSRLVQSRWRPPRFFLARHTF